MRCVRWHVGGKETGFQGGCSGEGVGARNPVSSLRFETGFLGGFGREMRGWGQPGFWVVETPGFWVVGVEWGCCFGVGAMKVKDIIKILENDGWYHVRTRGSHRQFHHSTKSGTVTVSGKLNVDMPPGTFNSVLKQAGLK